MPAQSQDDDFLSTLPDTSKTGVPYTSTDRTRGRRRTATEDDDFLSAMPDTTGQKTYSMQDAGSNDSYNLLPGVKIVGRNADGDPILAPEDEPAPKGSAARRFLSSAFDVFVGAGKGLWHGLTDDPRNDLERSLYKGPMDRGTLIARRFIIDPIKQEAQRTAEEWAQANEFTPPWKRTGEEKRHGTLMAGHALATVLPFVGPMAAAVGEKVGTQYAAGDVAGAAGTLAGNVALYEAPKGLARVAKSELVSRTVPRYLVRRMIRPMSADLKFGKDPTRAILDEGIVGNRLEDVGERVAEKLSSVGKELDHAAQQPAVASKVVNVSSSLAPLNSALREAAQAGDRALFTKLQDIKTELTSVYRPFRNANGEVTLRRVGPRNMKMSPVEALVFKRQIGRRVRWASDPLDGEVNQALGSMYGAVKDQINSAVPGVKELNGRYADLLAAAKAIERRLPVEARQSYIGLVDVALGASGHPLLMAARHAARWPAIRTRAAQGLYRLPGIVPQRPALLTAPATAAAAAAEEEWRRLAGQP